MDKLIFFFFLGFAFGCQTNCSFYGSTIYNTSPYNTHNFFYLDEIFDCKRCYFNITSEISNQYSVGIYNNLNNRITFAITTDFSSSFGFDTCQKGYCCIVFDEPGIFDTISINMIEIDYLDGCSFSNQFCDNNGLISSTLQYSNTYPEYQTMGCQL